MKKAEWCKAIGKSLVNKLTRVSVEIWTFFMIGIKQQASLAPINALLSMVIPNGIFLLMSVMPIEMTRATAIVYISGSIIVPMSNLCITTLAQILIGIRMNNGFEHMATLPIYRASPMLGMLFSSAVGVLPAIILNPYMGSWIFATSFVWSIWLVLVMFLTLLIMVNIGAVIGTCSEKYQFSHVISMIAMFFVMFATPVYYALDSLPFIIRIFQRLLPFTYALEAMRSLMVNPALTSTVILDFLALAVFWVISMLFAVKYFTWKQRVRRQV
jgi:ABC-2 type transport system permease protein